MARSRGRKGRKMFPCFHNGGNFIYEIASNFDSSFVTSHITYSVGRQWWSSEETAMAGGFQDVSAKLVLFPAINWPHVGLEIPLIWSSCRWILSCFIIDGPQGIWTLIHWRKKSSKIKCIYSFRNCFTQLYQLHYLFVTFLNLILFDVWWHL